MTIRLLTFLIPLSLLMGWWNFVFMKILFLETVVRAPEWEERFSKFKKMVNSSEFFAN
jgi:hypothetical protein